MRIREKKFRFKNQLYKKGNWMETGGTARQMGAIGNTQRGSAGTFCLFGFSRWCCISPTSHLATKTGQCVGQIDVINPTGLEQSS